MTHRRNIRLLVDAAQPARLFYFLRKPQARCHFPVQNRAVRANHANTRNLRRGNDSYTGFVDIMKVFVVFC